MKYCVGLTGTIASGKSTVAGLFRDLGIDIIDADKISRTLTAQDHFAYTKIVAHFGEKVLLSSKELDRRALREIIVSDPYEKKWLEDLLHPLIREIIEHDINKSASLYCIIEIPLLLDKTMYPYLNRVLLIRSTPALQIARIMERDHSSQEQAQAILQIQPDNTLREQIANDIIDNNSSLELLKQEVNSLHQFYIQQIQQARVD